MKTSLTACDQKRRSFLKLSGLLGLGVASAALLPLEKAESLLLRRNEYKVSSTRLAMGTFVDMTAIHHSRDEAEDAIGKAFAEVDRLCAMLTRFDNKSPVAELNALRRLEQPTAEIQELIARSLYFHRDTQGAFDITVKPLIDLYQDRFASGVQPNDTDIDAVLSIVGVEKLRFQQEGLLLPEAGMGITLDGLAPGYIADRASEILTKNGITNHLVNGGGEIRVSGSAAKEQSWTVAIQDPNKNKNFPDVIKLGEGAISTSGNYEVFYDREKLFHHIVNSKTGHSPHLSASVTVMAPTAMDADILSTAVYVMEPEAGLAYINSRPGYECFILDGHGRSLKSSGWPV
ncbi:MAG: FAD:protein FMN transferase [Desulfobulbaceae bacterium]|jgi:thiamine biosynthesis lipoprotein|nr:FAD:protein FMN transferase [Desulfobulbaceae bacterium]